MTLALLGLGGGLVLIGASWVVGRVLGVADQPGDDAADDPVAGTAADTDPTVAP